MISSSQVSHISRNIRQRILPVKVAVAGGYHCGNLGDMALGFSIAERLAAQGISGGLQTIYNLEKWSNTPFTIMGGGAICHAASLKKIAARHKGDYSRVAIIGVDLPDTEYPDECLDVLRNAAYVSARSNDHMWYMEMLTGVSRFHVHADIAFSYQSAFCRQARIAGPTENKAKKLLVNVLPPFGYFKGNEIVPNTNYIHHKPELIENFYPMIEHYAAYINLEIEKALDLHYEVATIPFTKNDELFARKFITNKQVKHFAYHHHPEKMLQRMATADRIIATRLHANIFALKLGKAVTPIAYADKNRCLFTEMGLAPSQYFTCEDFAFNTKKQVDQFTVQESMIAQYENESETAIDAAIAALHIA